VKNTVSPNPVVIIGGGVAGLTAANLLARDGFRVAICEAASKLGGSCASTTLAGFTFNNGAVYLAVISVLDHVFQNLGLNRAELLPLRKITSISSTTLPDGTVVNMGKELDVTVTGGRTADKNRLKDELRRMIDKWQPVLRFATEELLLHPFSPWRMLWKGWRHLPKFHGTVASELRRAFGDDAVRSALSGALLYNGVPPQRMPVSAILGLVAQICEGFYLPEGGMGQLPQVLSCVLQKRGVKVFLNSEVEKIIVEDNHVRGVVIKGSGQLDTPAVISTASGMQTFGSLIDAKRVPSRIAPKLQHPRLSHRAVSIQLGLRNRIAAPAHSVSVLPWMEHQQDLFLQDGSEMKFPVYLVPTLTMPELAPKGGSIIEMFYPVRSDLPLDHWDERRKAFLTESAVASLSRTYNLDIAVTRVRSPKDFLETMHLFQGALYGLSPVVIPREQFPHTTPIAGLFLAGQTTFPGYGVGAAMMSGIFAAQALEAS
jgi:phytoene desaturase